MGGREAWGGEDGGGWVERMRKGEGEEGKVERRERREGRDRGGEEGAILCQYFILNEVVRQGYLVN